MLWLCALIHCWWVLELCALSHCWWLLALQCLCATRLSRHNLLGSEEDVVWITTGISAGSTPMDPLQIGSGLPCRGSWFYSSHVCRWYPDQWLLSAWICWKTTAWSVFVSGWCFNVDVCQPAPSEYFKDRGHLVRHVTPTTAAAYSWSTSWIWLCSAV